MNNQPNRPDIFVIGTMKGGTTALHHILTSHPLVHSGTQKEIHYFSLHFDQGEDWYHAHFDGLPAGQHYVDASPTYFDTATTLLIPRLIDRYNPKARVIVIARNPVERAISHFHHLRKVNKVPALQDMDCDAFFGRNLNQTLGGLGPVAGNFMNALNFSLYTAKVERFRRIFGDRLLVLDNSQLRNDAQETVARTFRHVGVEPVWDDSFTVIRHSHKTELADISPATFQRLSRILRPDYEIFCRRFDIPFNWPTPDE